MINDSFFFRLFCWPGRNVSKPVEWRGWMWWSFWTKLLKSEGWVLSAALIRAHITLKKVNIERLSCLVSIRELLYGWLVLSETRKMFQASCAVGLMKNIPSSGLWSWYHGGGQWHCGNHDDLWLWWPALWSWDYHR